MNQSTRILIFVRMQNADLGSTGVHVAAPHLLLSGWSWSSVEKVQPCRLDGTVRVISTIAARSRIFVKVLTKFFHVAVQIFNNNTANLLRDCTSHIVVLYHARHVDASRRGRDGAVYKRHVVPVVVVGGSGGVQNAHNKIITPRQTLVSLHGTLRLGDKMSLKYRAW